MSHSELTKLITEKLIYLNKESGDRLSRPTPSVRDTIDDGDIRIYLWESDGGSLELSIYEDGSCEFEVLSNGSDEILDYMIGGIPSQVYSWDNFPMAILASFSKD